MSQLNVNAIYDAAGGDSVDVFSENAAKVWIHFNGATNAIQGDFGVDTITDNGTGDYTVNFTTAFADTSYASFCMCTSGAASDYVMNQRSAGGQVAGANRFITFASTTGNLADVSYAYVACFGNQ